MTTNNNTTSKVDLNLGFILFLLFTASCIAIYSAQSTGQYGENFLLKQVVWYGIGIGIIAVVMTFDSDQLKKLEFHSSQKYEIIVTNDKGEEVFIYSKGKMFSQALETALLKSGENMEWEETWKHDPLPPGQYKAKVSILSHKSDNLSLEREWTVPPNN